MATFDVAVHSTTSVAVPTVPLNDGSAIPQVGFGVFQVPPQDTAAVTRAALDAGYRHIDTAQMYGNEAGVGEALRSSGLAREEVYLTTKLNNGFHRPDDARRAFDASLAALGVEAVDLFLIHWPLPTRYDGDFVSTWRTLIEFASTGRARSIGVSNFQPAHLDRLVADTGVVPAVNQIEVHPYWGNEVVRAHDAALGIVTEAWSPIAQGTVLDDPAVISLARAVGRTPAQIVLRWHLQRGDVVFPKTVTPARMRENLSLFDFELDHAQLATLTGLDRGVAGRTGPDPDVFDYIPG